MANNIKYKKYEKLEPRLVNQVLELEKHIFPKPLSEDKILRELSTKHNNSVFIAYDKQKPVGYKIGFERSKRIYYSWIGGILPEYRAKGIASELMTLQHKFAGDHGYKVVCTQTDNSFKAMIILNLKAGFEIKGTIQSTGDQHITIIMEKSLN